MLNKQNSNTELQSTHTSFMRTGFSESSEQMTDTSFSWHPLAMVMLPELGAGLYAAAPEKERKLTRCMCVDGKCVPLMKVYDVSALS